MPEPTQGTGTKRARGPLTVRLLRITLGQALVPDQRRLLISNQPRDRNPLQQVTLLEVPIHFRVGHDPRQRPPRHVEKLAQLVAPVLLVQVVEQGAARVRGVGDVQAAVFAARQLLCARGPEGRGQHVPASSSPPVATRTHIDEPSVDRACHQRPFSPRLLDRFHIVLEPVPLGRRKVGPVRPSGSHNPSAVVELTIRQRLLS